ncbi:myristoyl transferase [Halobacteriales archaeon QH_10_67_13]|nr:MAG: myristoyl transferase [Halobacteriales archaeon QH_10_67_13]
MSEIEVALDWLPNTNHTGLYRARANGYYDAAGLEVTLRSPAADDYETTPAKRVATGRSTVAIAPSESVISYQTHPEYPSLVAIAAVCQRDTSAIAAPADGDVDRPADLDGRTYASYDARFEDHIVRQLIRNDGGDGDVEIVTPPKLGIFDAVVDGAADATWGFMPWEGLLAEREGVPLNAFYLDEYDVPYGYTPTMLARPETIADRGDELAAFLAATGRGYREAAADPAGAARTLAATADPDPADEAFLAESHERLADAFLTDDGTWGVMDRDRWAAFVDWLVEAEVLTDLDGKPLPASAAPPAELYTDELLDATGR